MEGKPDFAGISEIDLNDLANKFRIGGFGEWHWAVSKDPADIGEIIAGS